MTASRTRSTFYSLLIHVAVIAVVLYATTGANPPIGLMSPMLLAARDLVFLPPAPDRGGGGGQNQPLPAQLGQLPRLARRVFTPPVVEVRNSDPMLPVEPTVLAQADVVIPALNIAQWGDPAGIPGTGSGGPGKNGGIGTGSTGGVGPGHNLGSGLGNGGVGGPDTLAGRGVFTAPVLLLKTEPAYSDEARKDRVQGTVVLLVEIDIDGHPRDIRVSRSLGFGLEERAMEAVAHWRFRPARRNGKPVPCTARVDVNFRLL